MKTQNPEHEINQHTLIVEKKETKQLLSSEEIEQLF